MISAYLARVRSRSLRLAFSAVLSLMLPMEVFSAPLLSADQNPCVLQPGQPLCETTLTWSGANAGSQIWTHILETGEVGGPNANGSAGSVAIPWIQPNRTYRFTLHAEGQNSAVLSTIDVTTAQLNPELSAGPCTAQPGQPLCTTILTWSGANAESQIWTRILETGQVGGPNAGGASGSLEIPWIQPNLTYRFTLYTEDQNSEVLRTIDVAGGALSADLSASPCIVQPGQSLCTTVLSWSGVSSGSQIWTRVIETGEVGGPNASGASGSVSIAWIQPNRTYRFTLYADDQNSTVLADIDVIATLSNATLSANPNPCTVQPGQSSCASTLTWSGANAASQIWARVVETGQLVGVSGGGVSGSIPVNWIQPNLTYQFELHQAGQESPVIASTQVRAQAYQQLPASYEQFAPYLESTRGYVGFGAGPLPSWESTVAGNRIQVAWGSNPGYEDQALRDDCRFVWLYGYAGAPPVYYPVDTSKALLTIDGVTTDITGECGSDGQPYALRHVDGRSYRIQVWGTVYEYPGAPTTSNQRYYWDASWSYNPSSPNPCWSGPDPVRPALVQREAWWTKPNWPGGEAQWARGATGAIGANGEPSGDAVEYATEWEIGYGAGFSWNLHWLKLPYGSTCLNRTEALGAGTKQK